jgi:hypothetical protein
VLELLENKSSQGLGRIFYFAPYGTCSKIYFVDELLYVLWLVSGFEDNVFPL